MSYAPGVGCYLRETIRLVCNKGYGHCRVENGFPSGGLLRVSDGTEQTGHLTLAGEQTPSVSIADALR